MNKIEHKWSGWPGAFCLICGFPDLTEIAIGKGHYYPSDPHSTDEWKPGLKVIYEKLNEPCPANPRKMNAIYEFAYSQLRRRIE